MKANKVLGTEARAVASGIRTQAEIRISSVIGHVASVVTVG